MKRILALLLVLAMVVAYVPSMAVQVEATGNTQEFAGGSGTKDDPYLISTVNHLYKVRYYLNAHFLMINDIDLTLETAEGGNWDFNGNGWNPIGSNDTYTNNPFRGEFNGNGHSIIGMRFGGKLNLRVNGTYRFAYMGLFANNEGIIHDLTIKDVNTNLSGSYIYYGTIAAQNNGEIYNCSVSGNINISGYYVGGIVGENHGTIRNCYNASKLYGSQYIGGIAGLSTGTIENCYNAGDICSNGHLSIGNEAYAGGIASDNSFSSTQRGRIQNCYNIGIISVDKNSTHSMFAKQLCGISWNGSINNCYYLKNSSPSASGGTELTDTMMQEKSLFAGFDFDSDWTMGGNIEYLYPELQCFALSGKVSIQGNVANGETVNADISGLKKVPSTLTYQWYLDGSLVQSGTSYTVKSTDVGKKLTLTVRSSEEYCSGSITSTVYIVGKGIQKENPIIPELLYSDDNKFEISTVSTQEYSIDTINWQTSGVFENLEPENTYTVYTRILETDVYLLGESTEVLKVYLTAICDHEWDVSVTQPATYTSMGKKVNTCIYCGEEKAEAIPAKFYGTSINLGNTLDMYFGFYTGLVDENGKVVFVREFADGTTETTEVPITSFNKNNSVYDITYTGLAAKEMCDTIHVYVYNSEGTLVGEHSDSIRSYILRQLREKDYGQEFRTLCVDLLNYGAAAQIDFGYSVDDLANKDLTAEELAEGTQAVDAFADKQTIDGDATSYYGTAYILETQISMSMAVRADRIGANCYALVSYTNHMGEEKTNIRLEGKKNYSVYEFFLNEIVVADGRCLLTIEFYKADGTKVLTVQDSMESYTARNAADYPLAEKMLVFSDSAYKYLHRNDK